MKPKKATNLTSVAFTADTAQCIDPDKIRILQLHPYEMQLQSVPTGHIWRLWIDANDDCIRIWHKHHASDPYHAHAVYCTIDDALLEITDHDAYQLNHRRPTQPVYTRHGIVQRTPHKKRI